MILMFIGIGIGSVSADMKKILSAIYRNGRFEKWDLLVLIGIGRYEKKLIGCTLDIIHTHSALYLHASIIGKLLWLILSLLYPLWLWKKNTELYLEKKGRGLIKEGFESLPTTLLGFLMDQEQLMMSFSINVTK